MCECVELERRRASELGAETDICRRKMGCGGRGAEALAAIDMDRDCSPRMSTDETYADEFQRAFDFVYALPKPTRSRMSIGAMH